MMDDDFTLEPDSISPKGNRYSDYEEYEASQKTTEQELFEMVYVWGRLGIVVDHTAPAFVAKIETLKLLNSDRPF